MLAKYKRRARPPRYARCENPVGYNSESGHINVQERFAVEDLLGNAIVGIAAVLCAAHGLCAVPAIPFEVAPGVYALPGSGGNITSENGGRTANAAFVVGPDGVVVVDTGISYRQGEEIIAFVIICRCLKGALMTKQRLGTRCRRGNKTRDLSRS